MYPFFDVRSKNQADIRKSNLPSNLDLAFNQPLLADGGIVHKSIIGAECSLEDRCKFPDTSSRWNRPQKYHWRRV